jgi:hypothetical protein
LSNVITIKKSTGSIPPASLERGELAYTEGNKTLLIGSGTGVDTVAGRGLLEQSDNKFKGTSADIGNVQIRDGRITNVFDPISDRGVATKQYVDDKYSQERYDEDITTSEWVFNTNQHEWAVTHNFGYYPDVTTLALINGDDYEEFDAYVKHNSVNDLTVICSGTTTGKLLLR